MNVFMLTPRQLEVFNFIQDSHASTGILPSTREIQTHFGYASQTSVMDLLQTLERKGVLRRSPGKARSLQLVEENSRVRKILPALRRIPIFGSIPAGLPAEALVDGSEAEETLELGLETLRLPAHAKVFALRVRGDSMIGAGILPGDTVVLEQREPRPGDIVAALIDGEVTLKRYLLQDGQPFLRAENDAYPDLIPVQELRIQGVQVALFRIAK